MSTIDTITSSHTLSTPSYGTEKHRSAMQVMIAISTWLSNCAERRRSRRVLAGLSDEQLHDIGISRADAENEANAPFWRSTTAPRVMYDAQRTL